MNRFESEMHLGREREHVAPEHVLLAVAFNPLAHHRDNSLHARRHMPRSCDSDVHPPPLARVVLDPVEDGLVEFEDHGQTNRLSLSREELLEGLGVLGRFYHVLERTIWAASSFEHDPLNRPAASRISLAAR